MTAEPNLTVTFDIDPAQLPEVSSATIMRFSVRDKSNLDFSA